MKVLHIITGLGVGGAEQQLRLMLRQSPATCDVVTLTTPGPVAKGLAADGVRVRHVSMSGNRDMTALPRLTRLIRAGRYDLVHTHLYRACLYGRVAARIAGVPAIATEHSLGDCQIEGRPLTAGVRALYLATERLGRATIAVSSTVAERLRLWGVPADRIHVVPNGIDAARFRFDPDVRHRARRLLGLPPDSADAFVIGAVGRLTAGKRFEILLHALSALPGRCLLLLVGGGPEEVALRHTAQRLCLADRVIFAGERPYPAPVEPAPQRPRPLGWSGPGAPRDPGAPWDPGAPLDLAAPLDPAAPDLPGTRLPKGPGLRPVAERDLPPGAGPPGTGPPGLPSARTLPALLAAMDALAAPCEEETFGLAALEALAAGLPVRYTACPALDDLPSAAAPGARRVASTPQAYARALHELHQMAPHRLPVPDAVHHYGIAHTAELLTRVYETVLRDQARIRTRTRTPTPTDLVPSTDHAPDTVQVPDTEQLPATSGAGTEQARNPAPGPRPRAPATPITLTGPTASATPNTPTTPTPTPPRPASPEADSTSLGVTSS